MLQVKRRADGKSRWFGFVTFTSAQAAEQVVQFASYYPPHKVYVLETF